MDLKDKNVVITGASGGIGCELCRVFDEQGARLITVSSKQDKIKCIKDVVNQKNHKMLYCDFTKTNELEKLVDKIKSAVDEISVLINAAGVGVYKNIEDVTLDEWKSSLAVNATAPFYLTQQLLPLLKKSETSVVINIGSGMGKIPTACRSVYCATKYALRGMTLSLAAEFAKTSVHFIHVALGSTLTEFGPLSLKEKKEENLKGKSYFTPQWVAEKFIHIIKNNEFQDEITFYPSDYS